MPPLIRSISSSLLALVFSTSLLASCSHSEDFEDSGSGNSGSGNAPGGPGAGLPGSGLPGPGAGPGAGLPGPGAGPGADKGPAVPDGVSGTECSSNLGRCVVSWSDGSASAPQHKFEMRCECKRRNGKPDPESPFHTIWQMAFHANATNSFDVPSLASVCMAELARCTTPLIKTEAGAAIELTDKRNLVLESFHCYKGQRYACTVGLDPVEYPLADYQCETVADGGEFGNDAQFDFPVLDEPNPMQATMAKCFEILDRQPK